MNSMKISLNPAPSPSRRAILRGLALAAALVPLRARTQEPAPVIDGIAPVGPDNLVWDPEAKRLRVRLSFPARPPRRRLAAAKPADDRAGRFLTRWVAEGRAAGLHGDVYDNRDRGHSTLRREDHPRLAFSAYPQPAREAGFDYGLNEDLLFDAVVIGNSSTALTGPAGRSQARHALSSARGAARAHQTYAANHLYVFPEHRDHDPDRGDLLHAAPVFFWVSQGSSRSDRPALRALTDVLAALRPETKALARSRGLLGPTARMILGRALTDGSDAAWLDGAAHGTVLAVAEGALTGLDRGRLIAEANALAAGEIPPWPRLRVVEEDAPAPGIELFGEGLSERLYDTPSAVSRLARGAQGVRRYVLEAEAEDPNGRPLDFHWRVLRGDPQKVSIAPLDAEGRRVALTIRTHGPRPVPGRPDVLSPRVDVGLFADNGTRLSAPAVFSLYFPQGRALSHDAEGRPLEAEYAADPRTYLDPVLFPRRDWRDVYDYAPDGALLGWTRHRPGAAPAAYTRHGFRVLERDAEGRPALAERVAYPLEPDGERGRRVAERPTGARVAYAYDGPDDRLGWLEEAPAEATGGEGG